MKWIKHKCIKTKVRIMSQNAPKGDKRVPAI